jgi:hypothetical protein
VPRRNAARDGASIGTRVAESPTTRKADCAVALRQFLREADAAVDECVAEILIGKKPSARRGITDREAFSQREFSRA